MKQYYVEIYNFRTGEVAKVMGPFSEYKADRVSMGAEINMDHENWATRLVPAEDSDE